MLPPNMQAILQQFQQFKSTFRGDPRQQVQSLLNSGKVSQTQYNQAVQMANQLAKMMGGK
jgi:vancomycin permeability regulator SanA